MQQVLTKFWGLLNSSGERVVRIIVSASNDVRCHLESYTPRVGSRYSGLNIFLLSTLLTLSTYMTSQLVNTLTNSPHHQMLPPGLTRKAWAQGRVDEFVCLLHTQLATIDTDVAIVGSTQGLTLYHTPPSIYDRDTLEECTF